MHQDRGNSDRLHQEARLSETLLPAAPSALYGVAMGGECGVGTSQTMESIPRHARGFVSGLMQSG
jgi:hypothetical protein